MSLRGKFTRKRVTCYNLSLPLRMVTTYHSTTQSITEVGRYFGARTGAPVVVEGSEVQCNSKSQVKFVAGSKIEL